VLVKISQELLQDTEIDIEALIRQEISEAQRILENPAFVNGAAADRPRGILQDVVAGVTGVTGNTLSMTADSVYDLVGSLLVPYRLGASFLLNDTSRTGLRKLKDGQGRYLWEPSLQVGQPDKLLGYPVHIDPDMPVMAANAKSVLFGDFSKAYLIRNVVGGTQCSA
jgi:HK97 family phage major capsid protein